MIEERKCWPIIIILVLCQLLNCSLASFLEDQSLLRPFSLPSIIDPGALFVATGSTLETTVSIAHRHRLQVRHRSAYGFRPSYLKQRTQNTPGLVSFTGHHPDKVPI